MSPNPVAGKTLRFTFEDGPMAGRTFEHRFEESGAVRFRQAGAAGEGTIVQKYEAATVAPDVCVVSYRSSSGYTLTVALNGRTKKLVAFSSNEKTHLMQIGKFEEVQAQTGAGRRNEEHPAARH
jgi:hypothetical protein